MSETRVVPSLKIAAVALVAIVAFSLFRGPGGTPPGDEAPAAQAQPEAGAADGPSAQAPSGSATPAPARPARGPVMQVLFIGNSLTYSNDLPSMIAGFAAASSLRLETRTVAPGGARLADHVEDAATLEAIRRGGWRIVVLQEQSQIPSFGEEEVDRLMMDPAVRLAQEIRYNNASPQVVLYQAMAHRDGDAENAELQRLPELATYEGAQRRINAAYDRVGARIGATVAPVGRAWERVRRERPELQLYADEVHPNRVGSYLAACVLYTTITRRSVLGSSYTADLEPELAAYLQRVASMVR